MEHEPKTWIARAWAVLEEQAAERMNSGEWVQRGLRLEDWKVLAAELVDFARGELARRRWRGAQGGVVPGGYDADSVATEAIAQLLGGRCRLGPGFTREALKRELERLAGEKVRLLHRLKEAAGTRGEWDMVRPEEDASEPVSILSQVREPGGDAFDAAVEREAEERREGLRVEFEDFLKREPELLELFRCWRMGVTGRREAALRLGVDEKRVAAARKRLERRITQFGRMRASPRVRSF
jgi:hypothetical protein